MRKIMYTAVLMASAIMLQAQTQQTRNLNQKKAEKNTAAASQDLSRESSTDVKNWQSDYHTALASLKAAERHLRANRLSEIEKLTLKADQLILPLIDSHPQNSEIRLLKAYSHILRMAVNPAEKYVTEGRLARQILYGAQHIDPQNPRFDLMRAQLEYYYLKDKNTDKNIRYLFERAAENLKKYKPATPQHPTWGLEDTSYYLSIIK